MANVVRPVSVSRDTTACPNLADGWYVAVPSSKLGRKPRRVDLFGQPFVAWRTADGAPSVLASTCPHMGAALFDGKVRGGFLQCPFHQWQFATNGRCVSVPTRNRPPAAAATTSLLTREHSGYIWVWYGTDEPPFGPPCVPELETGINRFRLADPSRATVRRILENTYDPDHLVALHGLTVSGPTDIKLTSIYSDVAGLSTTRPERLDAHLSWPRYSGVLGNVSAALGLNAERFELKVRGWATSQQIEYFADGRRVYVMVLATTPIGPDKTVQHINASVDPHGRGPVRLLRSLMHRLEVTVAARQDIPVFDSLMPGDRHGIYVPGDHGVKEFRRFYQRWVRTSDGT